jgi:hypothetical protein
VLDASGCTTSDWSGDKFYNASGSGRPIYTSATAAKDNSGNMWVFWGTGDKVDPTSTTSTEYFYAVKDALTTTLTSSNLTTITTAAGVFDPASTLAGYRIQMLGTGEKILGDPTVYGGVAYYTSFVPGDPSDPCYDGGDAYLNAVYFNTGKGGIVSSGRQINVGSGMASTPIVSMAPIGGGGPIVSLYVTVSGGGTTGASTKKIDFNMPGLSLRTNLLFWRDRRIE